MTEPHGGTSNLLVAGVESRLSRRTVTLGLCGLYLLGLAGLGVRTLTGVPPVFTAPPMVLALSFVPGGLVLLAVDEEIAVEARTVVYALGISLGTLIVLGFLANMLLPMVGVMQPLATTPLVVVVTAAVAALAGIAMARHRRHDGEEGVERRVTVRVPPLASPAPLALALLPFGAILAVSYLNGTEGTVPVLLVLGAVALVPLVAVSLLEDRWHPVAIWTTALAILYHKTFWANFGFTGSPTVVNAWSLRRWTPNGGGVEAVSTSLLPNAVLFPTLARLSGVNIVTELEVINPLFVSFIPVALFVAYRNYVGTRPAVLGATLFAFAHPFYIQYPTAGRAATPVIFLSMLIVVLSDDRVSTRTASALSLLFVGGLVVSHYGTSYYVMTAFVGALGLLFVLSRVDRSLEGVDLAPLRADGGVPARGLRGRLDPREYTVFSWRLVALQSVAAIAWYMYTAGGNKWEILPRHLVSSYESLTSGGVASGRTANRIQENYGSLSIRVAKYVYITLAVLMLLGLLVAYYRRFVDPDRRAFDDRFLALATAMLGLFGFTLIARNWGGGRPMMITFTFTAIFAVVGFGGVVSALQAGLSRVSTGVPQITVERTYSAFAVVLLVLFSLNSGLVGGAVTHDRAPNLVPVTPQFEDSQEMSLRSRAYREQNIQTHVWMVTYHGSGTVYGDFAANGQTDWYRPQINLRSGGLDYGGWKPRGDIRTLTRPGIEPGYVIELGHNQALHELAGVREEDGTYRALQRDFNQRHRVYMTGDTAIYYGE